MVLDEYRMMPALNSWHCVEGCVIWFYRVSHYIMTPNIFGRPPRSTHEELLENQQAQNDHVSDVLSICQCIQLLRQEAFDLGVI